MGKFPIRDMERERNSVGHGKVNSRFMSPEELEDYRARTGFKEPRNRDGEKVNQPIQHGNNRPNMSSEEQSRRAKMRTDKGSGPDKQKFLKLIAEGKTIAAAEKDLGMKLNGMYYWLKKWDLIGINAKKAKELLGDADGASLPTVPDAVPEKVIIDRLETRMKEYENDALKARVEVNELRAQVSLYEDELACWAQIDSEKQLQINNLLKERDQWDQERNNYLQAIAELEEERQLLLVTIEKAATPAPLVANDNVHNPAHYTAGGIECIDAIEAAVVGLSGPQAYSTGAAIKYLWRYSRKNGVEDLQKASWYVNRLIGEVAQG